MIIFSLLNKDDPVSKMIRLLGQEKFKNLSRAVRISANKVGKEWKKRVMQSGAKEGWKTRYALSIQPENTNDPFISAFSSEGMFTNFVETGVKSFDMKQGLLSSSKAKLTKGGNKILTIFMRKKLKSLPSNIRSLATSLNTGESINEDFPEGIRSKLDSKYTWKSGLYQGLTKVGEPGHSQYGTFRIVSSKSKGWIFPGTQSYKIFDTLKDMDNEIKETLGKGLLKDLSIGVK